MRFISLASGSKGNAYLVQAGGRTVLVDAGLSGRELERRMQAAGVMPSRVDLAVLTHEHADHIQSAALLSRRHGWSVAATEGTLYSPCGEIKPVAEGTTHVEILPANTTITVGGLTIRSFSVSHDAADPVGYVFAANGTRLALATDLGEATLDVNSRLADVDLLVLESNHCPRLLQRGPYPSWLKRRIASPLGHLSNVQAGDAIRAVAGPRLRHLLLAHLSENNNDPRTAFDAMRAVLAESAPAVNLLVCRQHQIGSWIDLEGE